MASDPETSSATFKWLRQRPALSILLVACLASPLAVISSSQSLFGPSANPTNARRQRKRWDLGGKTKFVPGQLLIRLKPSTSARTAQELHARIGAELVQRFRVVKGLELVKLPPGLSVKAAIRQYRGKPEVLYAEPNYIVHAATLPNDPLYPEEWGLSNTGQYGGTAGADIHAPSAWDLSTGNSGVVVATLDTGIDYNHQDLAANIWSAPTSFSVSLGSSGAGPAEVSCPAGTHGIDTGMYYSNLYPPNCDPMDNNGHGTHVAGIIGAVGSNNVGVAGVNWNVSLMACKFLDASGEGSESGAIACLDFVKAMKDSGVNIVATNNSWGGDFNSQALLDAIEAQEQDGILFVAAAGNEFEDNDLIPAYPADFFLPNILSVAATTPTDDVVSFSNLGRHTVDLGAPGEDILSTTPNNTYSVFSGTSMAAPFVTGVAALLKAQNPDLDWRAIKNLILTGGDTIPSLAETLSGRRLNAYGSMTCSNSTIETRLQPVPATTAGSVGTPVNLSVLNINCGQPNGNEEVTVSPGGTTVPLVDNGTGSDQAPADGIYSGQWTPPALGSYSLAFPGGDSVAVEVLKNYTASVVNPADYNYRSITGTNLDLGDDSVAEISSPFPIPFGGGSFTNLFVSSNGTISFTNAFGGFNNENLPIYEPPYYPSTQVVTLVAPFWEDLYPQPGSGQNVFWEVDGAPPNRELVVEWRNVGSFECSSDSSATVKFQVVFFENSSNVLFNYADATFGGGCADEDRGASATVGIQIAPGVGTQWSFNAQDVGDATGILWQLAGTAPPANPVPAITSISPSSAVAGGPDLPLTVNGSNFVEGSRVQLNSYDRVTTFVSSTQLVAFIPASDLTAGGGGAISVVNPAPGGGSSNSLTFMVSNPVPTITSLSPSSAAAGGFSFLLTVNGTGFTFGGTSVDWNGQPLQTTYVSSTQLLAAVMVSQVATAGTVQVTVDTSGPGGGTSAPVAFTITSGTLQPNLLGPAQPNQTLTGNSGATDSGTSQVSAGSQILKTPYRFWGWNYTRRMGVDYFRHFVRQKYGLAFPVQNPSASGGLSSASPQVLASPPPLPGFLFRKPLPAGFIPTGTATGDFNRDGKMDWVVSNGGSNDLWLYLGKGDGTSQLPIIIPLTGISPVGVAAADLRGNGISDLIVAEADSQSVGVLLGNGDGTFGPETTYYMPAPPLCLLVRDFTGDGHPDVLVGMANTTHIDSLALLPGDGQGGFGRPIFRPYPSLPFGNSSVLTMAAADLNGDGLPDVVVNAVNGLGLEEGIFAYLNQRDGTFKESQVPTPSLFISILTPSFFYTGVALGDLNGDGCADLVVLDSWDLAERYLGNCDGTFQDKTALTAFGTGNIGYGAALADVNGDGNLDLVSSGISLGPSVAISGLQAGNLLSVLLGDGIGGFSRSRVYRGEPSMYSLALADLNDDGRPDVVTANQDSDSTSVFLNDGQGGFGAPQGTYLGYNVNGIIGAITAFASQAVAEDLNGDGKPDLSVLESGDLYPNPYNMVTLLNNGDGTFSSPLRSNVLDATFFIGDLALSDFRNTGRPDLVIIGPSSQFSTGAPLLSFAPNNGDGSFGFPTWAETPEAQGFMGVGDFNGDGKLDFVAVQSIPVAPGETSELTVFLGNGSGGFTAGNSTTFNANSSLFPGKVYVGDFNHDGKLDVLVQVTSTQQGTQGHNVYELLGNGDGTFSPAQAVLSDFGPFAMGDLNHDGLPDIVELVEPATTLPSGPGQYAIYLGQPDGSFKLSNTYQPYDGELRNWYTPPTLVDFNGDGNLDIAVFQNLPAVSLASYGTNSYFQIMAGNGDGTFTPTYTTFDLPTYSAPQFAADVTGDGRADLIELDGYTSSYHVIPAAPGPAMQIRLVSDPVFGSNGNVQINLAVASSSSTTIALSASDPAITLPASISIPAGSVTQDVPFQIGSSFNPNHVFSIQAQLGTETETAYGTQTTQPVGIRLFLLHNSFTIAPGQTTSDYGLQVYSVNGYSTTVQLQCNGLPAGATCQFGSSSVHLPVNSVVQTTLSVATTTSLAPGSYPFTIVATDGTVSDQVTATVNTGDFTLSISPSTVLTTPSSFANLTLTISGTGGFNQYVDLSASGLPPGTHFVSLYPQPPGTYNLTIETQSVAPGNYPFTITGTSVSLTHSVSATLDVVQHDVTGSISPTSATIATGNSAEFAISLTSLYGTSGTSTLSCSGVPAGTSCTFSPASLTLTPNGTATSTMTVSVLSRPSSAPPSWPPGLHPRDLGRTVGLWVAILLLVLMATLPWRTRRGWKTAHGFLFFLILCSALAGFISCGGGGSSTSSPSGLPPVTFTLTVQAGDLGSTSQSKTIGTVSITVP